MSTADEDLTPAERDALGRLPREAVPPRRLEDTTVAALTTRGLLRPGRRAIHPALALAASLLIFAGGLVLGRLSGAPDAPADARPRFALFLYEGPGYDQPAPGALEQRVQEYVAWASAEREDGEIEGGEKLREDADVAIEPGGAASTIPLRPGEPRLAGYFLVRAADRHAAVEIARSCPHVRYGGRIVVREIDPT